MGTNRYAYSFNDPVNKIDPNGNEYKGATPDWNVSQEEADGINTERVESVQKIAGMYRNCKSCEPETIEFAIALANRPLPAPKAGLALQIAVGYG